MLGEPGHEALKRRAELGWIELAEQPAERVMAGHAVGQLEKAAQERLFRFGEFRHVNRALTATENRAERDHQKLMKIMQTRVAASRIFQTLPALGKLFHDASIASRFDLLQ